MNYAKHLTFFFNRIAIEDSITPTHISLYMAIFQNWNLNRFQNPVMISREEIMRNSKINSNATYHKHIKDLERLGFLEYNPSYNPYSGTSINVLNLIKNPKNPTPACSKNEQVQNLTMSKNEQVQ